jgi:HEAT repeat protein
MMNSLVRRLEGGDLRSDGDGDAVARTVLQRPRLFQQLYDGLHESSDVVRGRSAHALELVARSRPDLLLPHLPELLHLAERDHVAMVRWHIAMILGHLAVKQLDASLVAQVLLRLLGDPSAFVRSWSITSLTILGRLQAPRRHVITRRIAERLDDPSIAVRRRAEFALEALRSSASAVPKGWVKSAAVESLLRRSLRAA